MIDKPDRIGELWNESRCQKEGEYIKRNREGRKILIKLSL